MLASLGFDKHSAFIEEKTRQMMKSTVCGESTLMMWRKTWSTSSRWERHFRMLQEMS